MAAVSCGCDCHYLGGDLEPDTKPSGCGRCAAAHKPRISRPSSSGVSMSFNPVIACGCGCHLPRLKGEVSLGHACEFCREAHELDPVHPDIMKSDPDPEEPMTTIPIPTTDAPDTITAAGPVKPLLVRADGVRIVGRDAATVDVLIRKANANPVTRSFVQKAKGGEGTGTLGLYLEAVTHTGSGTPFTHMKFFVVDCHVYAYSRNVGDTRANWRHRGVSSLEAALGIVQKATDRPNVKRFGHPVLVELTSDDLSAIEEGGMPPARFRGQYRIEKDFGRYDFEMEVVSSNLPASLVLMLRNGYVTTPPVEP